MKKIIVTLAVLLLTAPVMADVTITCSAGAEPNTVVVSFSVSGEAELVRAIALDIQVNDPNVSITDVNCVSDGYYIYPGSIAIDAGGNVTDYGTCAGVLGSNDLTSEQGSLYVGAPNAPAPGDLFILTLGGCTLGDGNVGVTVSENQLRGGVVMEDAGAPSGSVILVGCDVEIPICAEEGCQCFGDVSGPTGVPDGSVSTSDMGALLGVLGAAGPPYNVCPVPAGFECMDLSGPTGVPDGCLSTADMGALLSYLGVVVGPPYVGGCMPAP
jgi:hypothetical protein